MEIIAVALAAGVTLAVVTGGSLGRMLDVRLRLVGLLFAAFGIQLLLGLWEPSGGWSRGTGLGLFVASFALLLVFCSFNLRVTGMSVVALGVLLNLVVIAANQGMPVRLPGDATDEQRARLDESITHQPEAHDDVLGFLGDIIVVPEPFSRSISFGDLILAVGVIDLLVRASRPARRRAVARSAGDDESVPGDHRAEGGERSAVVAGN